MEESKDQFRREDSLTEKRKLLLFLKMSVRSNSLKNHTLIRKVKKEIAREITSITAERKAKNNSN